MNRSTVYALILPLGLIGIASAQPITTGPATTTPATTQPITNDTPHAAMLYYAHALLNLDGDAVEAISSAQGAQSKKMLAALSGWVRAERALTDAVSERWGQEAADGMRRDLPVVSLRHLGRLLVDELATLEIKPIHDDAAVYNGMSIGPRRLVRTDQGWKIELPIADTVEEAEQYIAMGTTCATTLNALAKRIAAGEFGNLDEALQSIR